MEVCEFCRKLDWGTASCETDKYGSRLVLASGSYRFPVDEQFNFCPVCGRRNPQKELNGGPKSD